MHIRNIGIGKRHILNTSKAVEMNYDISKLFDNPTITNTHSLIHLSKRQWKRMKQSIIHMSDVSKLNGINVYSIIEFGKCINKNTYTVKHLETSGKDPILSRMVSLDNVKGGFVVMNTTISDVEDDIDKGAVLAINSTYCTATNDYVDH